MKKKLFSIALLFMMVFAFTACGAYRPNYGDRGYVDCCYKGISWKNEEAPNKALIASKQELKEYRETVQFSESVFWDSDYKGSRETVYTQLMDKFDSYSSRYFKDNVLVALIRTEPSGSNSYNVKSVAAQESDLSITLQRRIPSIGTADIQAWCILIECPKGDFTQLKVDVEDKYELWEADGTGFSIAFTHEASLETIEKDYTSADFPELDFEFAVEEYLPSTTAVIRQALAEESIDSQMQYRIDHFMRMFKFTLNEPNKENVLHAVDLLSEREEIESIAVNYRYFWEEE